MGDVFVTTAGATALAMSLLWIASVWKRDASIVDVYWGPGFVVIGMAAASVTEGGGARGTLSFALCSLWGLRLGAYLMWRGWGAAEDYRYQAMRRHFGARFWWVSLGSVFGLQGVLMWIVSLPVQVVHVGIGTDLGLLDLLGALVCLGGLVFESVGDLQLASFRHDPANATRVMDRGLWRYTRHPNYFGDALVWWGLGIVALSAPFGIWTLASPVLMTVLLLRVSGVPFLERTIGRRRPDYEAYRRRTSAFIPLPPKAP